MKIKWDIRVKNNEDGWYCVHYNAVSFVRMLSILFKSLKKYDSISIIRSKYSNKRF